MLLCLYILQFNYLLGTQAFDKETVSEVSSVVLTAALALRLLHC